MPSGKSEGSEVKKNGSQDGSRERERMDQSFEGEKSEEEESRGEAGSERSRRAIERRNGWIGGHRRRVQAGLVSASQQHYNIMAREVLFC